MKFAPIFSCLLFNMLLPQVRNDVITVPLERKQLVIEETDPAFFKSAAVMELYNNFVFIVDNASDTVLKFGLGVDTLKYLMSIGKSGQGPGDLERPIRISIWQDTLAIEDQMGISLFDINGLFKSKFRIFSGCTALLYTGNKLFCAASNPTKPDLIDVFSEEGERLYSFSEKATLLEPNYRPVDGMLPSTSEMVLFDVELLADESWIYMANRRFGSIIKYGLLGDRVFEADAVSFFGENEHRKAKENLFLFQKNGLESYKKDKLIPQNYLFRSARLFQKTIYLLVDQWDFVAKKKNPFIEIVAVDKNTLNPIAKYRGSVSQDERYTAFAIDTNRDNPVFIVLMDCDEGFKIFKYETTQGRLTK